MCEITAKELFQNDGQAELALKLDGQLTGAFVVVNGEFFCLSKKTTSLSLPEFSGKNQLSGLLTIIITRALDIPLPKEGKLVYVCSNWIVNTLTIPLIQIVPQW